MAPWSLTKPKESGWVRVDVVGWTGATGLVTRCRPTDVVTFRRPPRRQYAVPSTVNGHTEDNSAVLADGGLCGKSVLGRNNQERPLAPDRLGYMIPSLGDFRRVTGGSIRYVAVCLLVGSVVMSPQGRILSDEARTNLHGPWSQSVEPFRLVGNVYYVGVENIASHLITTPDGHILIAPGRTPGVSLKVWSRVPG